MQNSVKFELPAHGLQGKAATRDFEWILDEPREDGGTDLGPTPVEAVYGALAACIAITLRLYAQRKEWNTGKINVEVYTTQNEFNEKEIHKKISFENQLSAEQIKRLEDISAKCPVSKLLQQATAVVLD